MNVVLRTSVVAGIALMGGIFQAKTPIIVDGEETAY